MVSDPRETNSLRGSLEICLHAHILLHYSDIPHQLLNLLLLLVSPWLLLSSVIGSGEEALCYCAIACTCVHCTL